MKFVSAQEASDQRALFPVSANFPLSSSPRLNTHTRVFVCNKKLPLPPLAAAAHTHCSCPEEEERELICLANSSVSVVAAAAVAAASSRIVVENGEREAGKQFPPPDQMKMGDCNWSRRYPPGARESRFVCMQMTLNGGGVLSHLHKLILSLSLYPCSSTVFFLIPFLSPRIVLLIRSCIRRRQWPMRDVGSGISTRHERTFTVNFSFSLLSLLLLHTRTSVKIHLLSQLSQPGSLSLGPDTQGWSKV